MTYVTRDDIIDILDFSSRTYNLLRRSGIDTVGQLVDCPKEELKAFKHMGSKSLAEVLERIHQLNGGGCEFSLIIPSEAISAQQTGIDIQETAECGNTTQEGTHSKCSHVSIRQLGLSIQAVNCLMSEGIYTAADLLNYDEKDLSSRKGIGWKTISEVIEKRRELLEHTDAEPYNAFVFSPSQTSIEQLDLSVRAENSLKKAEIYTVADLLRCEEEWLSSANGIGQKTLDEILAKRKELLAQMDSFLCVPSPSDQSNETVSASLNLFIRSFSDFIDLPRGEIIREVFSYVESIFEEINTQELFGYLYRQEHIRKKLMSALIQKIESHVDGITRQALLFFMPEGSTEEILNCILMELEQREVTSIEYDLVKRCYPTAMDFAKKLKNDRSKDMLISRLCGETLAEIGVRYNVTRELVRQKIQKALRNRPKLYEDKYEYLFNHYELSAEEFMLAFDEPIESFNYLKLIQGKNDRRPISDSLSDVNISDALRRKVERVVYRQHVTIDGIRVRKDRAELADYTLKHYCRDLSTMDDFLQRYSLTLEKIGLADDPDFLINPRSYKNKFASSNDILWNKDHSFRYYPIAQYDFAPLLEALHLEQRPDIDFSSLKLFRDYPELMIEYDIRDEYELHNLLRKICPEGEDQRVQFKKMPTIVIGSPDRNQQVMDLLFQFAPIQNTALAEKYEEMYGVRCDTALGTHFACISPFLHNGVYRTDLPALPEEQQERLSQVLTKDFYRIEELRRIYLCEFPDAPISNINAYSIRGLGFHNYSGYVVSDRFPSAAAYFRHLLLSDDLVDMRPFKRDFTAIVAYGSELYKLREKREIIEYAPYQYININRLNESGISASDLLDYCETVRSIVRKGQFFTISSLRKSGFTHALDGTGFEEWFFCSLLAEDREHFSYNRLGHTKLFYRGQKAVCLVDFLRWLVEAKAKYDVYELHDILVKHYGLSIPFEKIIETVRNSDMYYDPIMEAVYIDYDTYFEEV